MSNYTTILCENLMVVAATEKGPGVEVQSSATNPDRRAKSAILPGSFLAQLNFFCETGKSALHTYTRLLYIYASAAAELRAALWHLPETGNRRGRNKQ